MLATAWAWPFDDEGWLFEPKWDGIRGVLTWDGSSVTIRTRTGLEVSGRYPELTLGFEGPPVVLDGEVAVVSDGKASFERLQQRSSLTPISLRDHPVSFVAFDLLHRGERSLVDLPLEDRLAELSALELPERFLRIPPITDGDAMWRVVRDRDLEGMVAKRSGSPYRPGVRSADWRKVAHLHTVKGVVGGFTPGEGGRVGSFGALLLGLWDGPALRWIGAVGTGFDDAALRAIRSALDSQRIEKSPFHPDREIPRATWVEPTLVAAVDYRNWTNAGRVRHPRFKGFTDDPVAEITWDREGP